MMHNHSESWQVWLPRTKHLTKEGTVEKNNYELHHHHHNSTCITILLLLLSFLFQQQ